MVSFLAGALGASGQGAAATRVACVGDSITFGVGASKGNAYPLVLGRMLGAGFEVMNFGDSGSTALKASSSSYWKTPAFTSSKASAPDVVVIMLGTNDSKTAIWRMGSGTFAADYRALAAEYAALPSKPRLYLVLPPPALLPSFTIDAAVIEGEIVPLIRGIATQTGHRLVDVFGAFKPNPRQYFGAGDGADIGDGVHPNDAGARRIAETVFRALTAPVAADGGLPPPADAGPDAPPPKDAALAPADAAPAADRTPAEPDALAEVDGPPPADARPRPDSQPAVEEPQPPSPPAKTAAAGCQCRAGGPEPLPGSPFVALSVGLALRARRIRRRPVSPASASSAASPHAAPPPP